MKLKKQNMVLKGLVVVMMFALVVGVVGMASAYGGSAKYVVEGDLIVTESPTPALGIRLGGSLSTEPTHLSSSDDFQAVNSQYHYGRDEFVGTVYFTSTTVSASGLTVLAGDTSVGSLVQGGATTTLTASTTIATGNVITAAQVCDNSYIAITNGNTTTVQWTLPTATALYADCLLTDGDFKDLTFVNNSSVTTTILIAGTGGTMKVSSSTSIGASGIGEVRILRDTASAYRANLTNLDD